MDRGMISKRYAKTLLIYAQKRGKDKQVFQEAQTLSLRYREFPALRRVMSNLTLAPAKKVETINACVKDKLSYEMKHFIRLLIQENREEFLQEICLSYQDLFREATNSYDVTIITAAPLNKETEQKISTKLENYIKGTVNLHPLVNPSLIGGYVILWDTYRLDASVATRLKQIKRRLTDTTNN
ncbi:F0F1 ATP synthase subunit delta [Parabacteroides sp. OttesenSCG-928-G07]|nr:F0F1 ATP synthase subunit delta [Parabacteroides sp. OttesenSCG-928-G21]MDL2277980.1 F0F1 ATP synthase subunit delta [Parabacteroides sp. OttesenSCG-928-G07]